VLHKGDVAWRCGRVLTKAYSPSRAAVSVSSSNNSSNGVPLGRCLAGEFSDLACGWCPRSSLVLKRQRSFIAGRKHFMLYTARHSTTAAAAAGEKRLCTMCVLKPMLLVTSTPCVVTRANSLGSSPKAYTARVIITEFGVCTPRSLQLLKGPLPLQLACQPQLALLIDRGFAYWAVALVGSTRLSSWSC